MFKITKKPKVLTVLNILAIELILFLGGKFPSIQADSVHKVCLEDNLKSKIEGKMKPIAGRNLLYALILEETPSTKILGVNDENCFTPARTDGRFVYINLSVCEAISKEFFNNHKHYLEIEAHGLRKAKNYAKLVAKNPEAKKLFLETMKDYLRWQAWKPFYEATKDNENRNDLFVNKLIETLEKHELMTVAIYQGNFPGLSQYRVTSEMVQRAKLDHNSFENYLELYSKNKILAIIYQGISKNSDVLSPPDAMATVVSWLLKPDSLPAFELNITDLFNPAKPSFFYPFGKDPYRMAGNWLVDTLAFDLKKEDRFKALLSYAAMNEKGQREFFTRTAKLYFGADLNN